MSHDLRNFFFKPTNTFKRKAADPGDSNDCLPPPTKRKTASKTRRIVVDSDSDGDLEIVEKTIKKVEVSTSVKLSASSASTESKVSINPASYFANTSLYKSKRSSTSPNESISKPLKEQSQQPLIPPLDNASESYSLTKKNNIVEMPSSKKSVSAELHNKNKSLLSMSTPIQSVTRDAKTVEAETSTRKTSVYFPPSRKPTEIPNTFPTKTAPVPLTSSVPTSPSYPLESKPSLDADLELNLMEVPPVGAENCLDGMTFVQTGEFKRLPREEVKDVVKRYGGRFTSAVSGKTTFLLVGEDSGEVKLKKAKELGTPILDEIGFYKLVKTKLPVAPAPAVSPKKKHVHAKATEPLTSSQLTNPFCLWTDKYKPTTPSELIGNKSLIERLQSWLSRFEQSRKSNFKFTGESNGTHLRAALLSGPPGIGKTTTAHLVAKYLGYRVLEFNASDARNKSVLDQVVKEALHARTLDEMLDVKDKTNKHDARHCVIMDEVDGMSAGDRGGLAQLVVLLKKTEVPIICICNDRTNPKLRTLSNYCLDLRFRRPDASQIRSRLMTICFREQLQIQPQALDALVASTQSDIRQILNLLSQYKLGHESLNYDEAKALGTAAVKDMTVSVFDSIRDLLSYELKRQTFSQRFSHYFTDYDLMPLFVQDNYLKCRPDPNPVTCLSKLSSAADAMCLGNHVAALIQSDQQWGLMNVHNLLSTVTPASLCCGGVREMFTFPAFLGNLSKINKGNRLLASLHSHTGKHGMYLNRQSFRLDFLSRFLPNILYYLQQENFSQVIETLDYYYLSKTDLDEAFELGLHGIDEAALKSISSTTKSKFTREYNKTSHPLAVFEIGKKKGQPVEESTIFGDEEEGDKIEGESPDQNEDNEDSDNDLEALKGLLTNQVSKKKASAASSAPKQGKRGDRSRSKATK